MEWVLLAFVMATIVAIVAVNKNRPGLGWFFYGLLFWPIALVHALVMDTAAGDDEKVCPHCAERVKAAALVCKHCGRDLPRPPRKAAGPEKYYF